MTYLKRAPFLFLLLTLVQIISMTAAHGASGDFLSQLAIQQIFDSPGAIATDKSGNLYVTDKQDLVQVFDSAGKFLRKWEGSGPIAVDGNGIVYVGTKVFDSYGHFLRSLGSPGDGQLFAPSGIAVDSNNNVYVLDDNSVKVFDRTGTFLKKWGNSGTGDGQFTYPLGIAVDDNQNVFVIDDTRKIQVFDSSGNFLRKWSSYGSDSTQYFYPAAIAADSNGNVYVTTYGGSNQHAEIEVFSNLGAPLGRWGNPGSREGELAYPRGIAVDGAGRVIVADTGNERIQVFDRGGTFLLKWGEEGFSSPWGITVDNDDNVYVVDNSAQWVQVLDSAGKPLRKFGSITYEGGNLEWPTGIALDGSGKAYVANMLACVAVFDTDGNFFKRLGACGYPLGIGIDTSDTAYVTERDSGFGQVTVFDSAGNRLKPWGGMSGSGDGQFSGPAGVATDDSNNIYVADAGNNRIQVFDREGTFLRKWGTKGTGDGQFQMPYGIAVDKNGHVYVVDSGNDRIQVFDRFGNFLGKWGSYGIGAGYFDGPTYVATDKSGARVYVSDTNNTRVQVFEGIGSQQLPVRWSTQDIGSVGVAGSASYVNGAFSVKGSGADIWGTADGFRYVYQTLTGDGQIIARVNSLQNTNMWAKAGVMIREALTANSRHAMVDVTPTNGSEFSRRLTAGGSTMVTAGSGSAPYWVKLVRAGNAFSGYVSSDGVNWRLVGSDTIPMASSVYIGLVVTSHNNAALCTATFGGVTVETANVASPSVTITAPVTGTTFTAPATITITATATPSSGATVSKVELGTQLMLLQAGTTNQYTTTLTATGPETLSLTAKVTDSLGAEAKSNPVTVKVVGVPSPWANQDIGSTGAAGTATYNPNSGFSVSGSGTDIGGTSDSFHYVYQPLTGDGEITAQVWSLAATNALAKAGVMIRETLEPGSRHAMIAITANNGSEFLRRVAAGGSTAVTVGQGKAPYNVKLARSGNTLSAYTSDGAAWTLMGRETISMPTTVYIGLAVTSHDNGTLSNASLQGVLVDPVDTPSIYLSSPYATTAPGPMTITATAKAGTAATITKVEFFADGNLLGTATTCQATAYENPCSLYSIIWSNISAGTYVLTARVTDSFGATKTSAVVNVTVRPAEPAQPTILLAPPALSFTTVEGSNPAAQTVAVSNGSGGTLSWTATADATAPAWLSVSPATGGTDWDTNKFTVSVSSAGLAAGTYNKNITITAPGALNTPQTLPVTLMVLPQGTETDHHDFTYANRSELLTAGWDFLAKTSTGTLRNTEQTTGVVVSYDQAAHPGILRIPADTGDLWENLNNTRNSLFRDLPANWSSIRLKLNFAPTRNYQQAGLVVYQDDNNYVQICRIYENGNRMTMARETGGVATNVNSVLQGATSNLFLRLDRNAGTDQITALYSLDGTTWTTLGSVTQALTSPRLAIIVGASPGGTPNADIAWVEVDGGQGATIPPTVTLTSPGSGATFTSPASIRLEAAATAGTGASIDRIDFYNGQTLIGTTRSVPPYGSMWNNVPAGSYSLTAKVTDSLGATATSSPVTVMVSTTWPSTWLSENIGSVGIVGSATYLNGEFSVSGSGTDIWGTADSFRYVYNQLVDNVEIIARVTSLQNTSPWAKAGVMIREGLEADSPHAFMALTPGNGAVFYRRLATGAISLSTAGPKVTAPYWVKLVRNGGPVGTTFSGYVSPDGVNWSFVGSDTISMGSYVFVGLAVTSEDNAALCTATFDSVSEAIVTPPTVSITTPATGATFAAPASIPITAAAMAGTGETVSKVDFYNGTTLIGTDTSSPYSFTWSNVAAGSYSLTAKVTDSLGVTATSQAVSVTVGSSQPTIFLAPATLAFTTTVGSNPSNQTVALTNSGGTLSWTATANGTAPAWLSVLPGSGTGNNTLTVSVNSSGLAAGTYTKNITVSASGAANTPQTLSVTLTVLPSGTGTGHYDFTYANRSALLAAGWDFLAKTSTGAIRNTEQTTGIVVSYDQAAHPGVLRIPADTGDLWANLNNTRNSLFRNLPANWSSIRMKLSFAPTRNYQQAGLLVYQDDNNYVQICRIYENGNRITMARETNGAATNVNSVLQSATSNLFLRLDRNSATEQITALYSLNGTTWTSLGSVTQALANPRLAIIVGASPGGTPNADIAWVEVMSAPITSPTVTITTPTNGASFAAPANIQVTAAATAGTGATISRVEFFNGTTLIGTDATSPYSITWSNVAAGSYSLTAIVIDSLGATATSTPVTATVGSVVPPTEGHYDFTYPDRSSLLAAGWDFLAKTSTGAVRNTEQTTGIVVSYDQAAHPGILRIPADTGDLWANLNNTRNSLFRDLPADWSSVRMKLNFAPTRNYQQAGLLAYQDDNTYVQVCRIYENGNRMTMARETNGTATNVNSILETASTNLYLRLDRDATDKITGFYSLNGTTWTSLGSVTQALRNPRLAIVVGASPGGYPNADMAWVEVQTTQ